MSLRVRLLVVVAVTFAVVVVGSVYAAHVSTQRELRSETDKFLLQRSRDPGIVHGFSRPPDRNGGAGTTPDIPPNVQGGTQLAEPDAIVQLLDTHGTVVRSIENQPRIPVDTHDEQIAAQGGSPRFRDVTVSGTRYRVLTVALSDGGAAQIARSTTSTDNVLSALDLRLLLIAIAGTVVAAGAAWLIARRIVRPVEQLTLAAEQIARTQDLERHIDVERRDEIGRLARSFNTMLAALGASRAQQRRLVMDAGHELRTPLTALRTNIELLRRARTIDDGERDDLLAAAHGELTELGDLVAELVDLATDARAEEPVRRVALAGVVEPVVERARRRTGREITFRSDDAAMVDGRASALGRAVNNLVDNACKFSPDGTAVDVTVRGAVVEVADRGPGIATEERALVFDRFYRADDARAQPGSGLGLAIVRQIAALHEGTVELLDRDGGGTIARFTLPPSPAPGDGPEG